MYSKGISWIDDCRIPFTDGGWGNRTQETKDMFGSKGFDTNPNTQQNDRGRFPANILVSDDMLNDGIISKSTEWKNTLPKISGNIYRADGRTDKLVTRGSNDKGSNSRYYDIDKWFNNLIDG
jgi:hypothetical protein